MWQQLATSFAAGLSLGPVCLLHCGVYHIAFLSRSSGGSRRRAVATGTVILAGRLLAYLLLGVSVGMLTGSGLPLPRPWVLSAVTGSIMFLYAVLPSGFPGRCSCTYLAAGMTGSAFLLGFVSGLSPCPPLLASGLIALTSRGVFWSVCTFTAFFFGSAICFIPILAGTIAISGAFGMKLKYVSRSLAGIVGIYALLMAGRELTAVPPQPGNSNPLPVSVQAHSEQAAPNASGNREEAKEASPAPAKLQGDIVPLYRKEAPSTRATETFVKRHHLSLHEALYYDKLDEGEMQCALCPRRCHLHEGERGKCGIRANIDGRLRALTYGRPVSITPDPIEKKPLFHVLPGSKALSVATVGCNSGCVFCQNYQISQALPENVRHAFVPPEKLVSIALERGDQGIAFTYTEPTVYYEYMLDTAKLCKTKGLKTYWITCGQINEAPLLQLCKYLDAANVDLKGFSEGFYREYCDFDIHAVLRTLKLLAREGVLVEVTNLIIPGANDDPNMIRDMCRWIVLELGNETPLHFSRFHPDFKLRKRPPTPTETLVTARDIAIETGLKHVYIGNTRVQGAGDTRCAQCGRTVICRTGFLVTENHLQDGKCAFCGALVHGRWQ